MCRSIYATTCFFLLLLFSSCVSAEFQRFRSWYPNYAHGFNLIVDNNCSTEYANYRNGVSHIPPELEPWGSKSPTFALIHCIIDHTPEVIKAKTASTQVVLGLMPTLLAAVGPAIHETAMLFVIGNRPLLALCLSIGSPTIFLDRTFHYGREMEAFKERPRAPHFPLKRSTLLVIVEYILVLAAIANVAALSAELSIKAAFSLTQTSEFLAALWNFVGIVIHVMGALTLRLRTTVHKSGSRITHHRNSDRTKSWLGNAFAWLKMQFWPYEKQGHISVTVHPVNQAYFFMTGATTMLMICHIIFGTLVFSSILFVSVLDGLTIIFRYLASVICCRVVIMYELAMVRDRLKAEPEIDDECTAMKDLPQRSGSVDN